VEQERRSELESSNALHRFLADYRDLSSWMSDMRALIAADDLAKDVPGAEALLERHQEHKVIILIIYTTIMIMKIFGKFLVL
jgi:spectrin alpha